MSMVHIRIIVGPARTTERGNHAKQNNTCYSCGEKGKHEIKGFGFIG